MNAPFRGSKFLQAGKGSFGEMEEGWDGGMEGWRDGGRWGGFLHLDGGGGPAEMASSQNLENKYLTLHNSLILRLTEKFIDIFIKDYFKHII